MVNFEKLLSPQARAMLARRKEDTRNCFSMTDVDLAQRLLVLAKEAREERPDLDMELRSYDTVLLSVVLPELATRLGLTVASAREERYRSMDARAFRHVVGIILRNSSRYAGDYAWKFIVNEAINGNPIVIALDRICPGDLMDRDDMLTHEIANIAHMRGKPFNGVWTPAMLMEAA